MIDKLDPYGEENGSRAVENETWELPVSTIPRGVAMGSGERPVKTFIEM
jgi:hypothetical protein